MNNNEKKIYEFDTTEFVNYETDCVMPLKTYILNTPILTHYGEWRYEGPLNISEIKALLKQGFISAVGHQSSAEFLTHLLGIEVSMNRIQITMNKGDRALVFSLKTRLPENLVLLDKKQIAALPFEFGLLTRLY
jgi:hypothetical protein